MKTNSRRTEEKVRTTFHDQTVDAVFVDCPHGPNDSCYNVTQSAATLATHTVTRIKYFKKKKRTRHTHHASESSSYRHALINRSYTRVTICVNMTNRRPTASTPLFHPPMPNTNKLRYCPFYWTCSRLTSQSRLHLLSPPVAHRNITHFDTLMHSPKHAHKHMEPAPTQP